MRISDWSSDVCSSDLAEADAIGVADAPLGQRRGHLARPLVQLPPRALGLRAVDGQVHVGDHVRLRAGEPPELLDVASRIRFNGRTLSSPTLTGPTLLPASTPTPLQGHNNSAAIPVGTEYSNNCKSG